MSPDELRRHLHAHIPLSAAMKIEVLEATPEMVRLAAPLAPNINHLSTAFGGSSNTLAILAAWSLVHVRQQARGSVGGIVIQHNTMAYDAPVTGSFEATCKTPDEEAWKMLWALFDRRGKGRIDLSATLTCDGEAAGSFEGRYVLLR